MSARIQTFLDFQAGVHFDNEFHMNLYELDFTFNIETESIREQNVAMDRVKFFLHECLQNCVFVSDTNTSAIKKYMDADLKVCTLPEEPYDQVLGIMLLVKLNAITEGKIVVTDITIGSRLSDGVSCIVSFDENLGPFSGTGWFTENNVRLNDIKDKPINKKVVKLIKPTFDWEDVYMSWEEKDPFIVKGPSSEIVFASFDNKTDK